MIDPNIYAQFIYDQEQTLLREVARDLLSKGYLDVALDGEDFKPTLSEEGTAYYLQLDEAGVFDAMDTVLEQKYSQN